MKIKNHIQIEVSIDTIIREREYLRGYIHCIQQRIIMYCSTCSQCEECDDVTVQMSLSEITPEYLYDNVDDIQVIVPLNQPNANRETKST